MKVQMKNLDITRFLQFFKQHDCEITNDGHVFVKTKDERAEALKYVKQAYESLYGRTQIHLKKSHKCKHYLCVNPSCYHCTAEIGKKRFEFLRELRDDVDWNIAETQGFEEYVKEYNRSMPDFLHITEEDLKQASFLKRKK